MIKLPQARYEGERSVEKVIRSRRSHRSFADREVTLEDAAQLLWAGQGITGSGGKRAASSAGALYPLELYLIGGYVAGLSAGVYRYMPLDHALQPVSGGDRRREVAEAALHQNFIAGAPLVLVLAGVEGRTAGKYGDRAARYILIESGCSAQNIHLQAEALGMGTVVIGAFNDGLLQEVLYMSRDEIPLVILPLGYTK